jgi:hypothetical protein
MPTINEGGPESDESGNSTPHRVVETVGVKEVA